MFDAIVLRAQLYLSGSGTGPQAIWAFAQGFCGQFARYRGRSMLQEQPSALVA